MCHGSERNSPFASSPLRAPIKRAPECSGSMRPPHLPNSSTSGMMATTPAPPTFMLGSASHSTMVSSVMNPTARWLRRSTLLFGPPRSLLFSGERSGTRVTSG